MDIRKLRGKMVERDVTLKTLSKALGISQSTLRRRFQNNGESLTIGEMHKAVETLSMTNEEAIDVFLVKNSH